MVSPLTRLPVMPSSKLNLAGHLQSPQSAVFAEPAGILVEQFPQGGLRTVPVESGMHLSGTRGAGRERIEAALVEGVGMALRTVCEAHPRFSAIRGGCSARELGEQYLGSAQDKGIGGVQPGL